MIIKVNYFDNQIYFSDNLINNIEITNKSVFYRFVKDLYLVSNGDIVEDLIFLDSDKEVSNFKLSVISDYFNFGFDDRKNINSISKYLDDYVSEEDKVNLSKQYKNLLKVFRKILGDVEVPLEVDEEIDLISLSKMVKLSIKNKENVLDNLLVLIDINNIIGINKMLIFINLKQYLTEEELIELYKYSIYKNVRILLVDSQNYGVTIKYEKKLIIDENLDEFVL